MQASNKLRLLNIVLLLSSLFGYIEWGVSQSSFLFMAEYDIISELGKSTEALLHPIVLLPMLAQLILIILIIRAKPLKWLNLLAVTVLVLLYLFLLLIGILVPEYKTILSALPLLITSFFIYRFHFRKQKPEIELI